MRHFRRMQVMIHSLSIVHLGALRSVAVRSTSTSSAGKRWHRDNVSGVRLKGKSQPCLVYEVVMSVDPCDARDRTRVLATSLPPRRVARYVSGSQPPPCASINSRQALEVVLGVRGRPSLQLPMFGTINKCQFIHPSICLAANISCGRFPLSALFDLRCVGSCTLPTLTQLWISDPSLWAIIIIINNRQEERRATCAIAHKYLLPEGS